MNQTNGFAHTHHVEEIEIPMPWGKVAGCWWGPRNKQPIIAIHGWQDNAGTWNKLLPLLPSTLSVLCIDLPGMGLSDHYSKGMLYYKFWDGLVLVRRIVKHFNWGNVTLMGHSLGGSISFMYASAFPDEVDGIICIDIASPAIEAVRETARTIGKNIDQILKYEEYKNKVLLDSYSDMIDMVHYAYNGSVSKENCKVMMERGMTRSTSHRKPGYYFNRDPTLKFAHLAYVSIEEALEYAKMIKCKVLNIKALPKSNATMNDYYDRVLAVLKENAELTYVEVEGTHHLHLETPERIANHVKSFLGDLFL